MLRNPQLLAYRPTTPREKPNTRSTRRVPGTVDLTIAAKGLTIDELANGEDLSALGTRWRVVSDRVMGGISDGRMTYEDIGGRRSLCLRGRVSLENNGGFLQLALDLSRDGTLDASPYEGVRLVVRGNAEAYNIHLKTEDTGLPWQSYRQSFETGSAWRDVRLPFNSFEPHRIDVPLDRRRLRRLGIVAIGRAFTADICVAEIRFY